MSAIPNLPESVLNGDTAEIAGATVNGEEPQSRTLHGGPFSTVNGPNGSQHHVTNGVNGTASQQGHTPFQIQDHPIENPRPLRVIVIGAGLSGILTAIRIPERIPNVSLQIYEKNPGVGGTWHENKYPGCACDIPSHSYQYSFAPNPDWSALYASSAEIERYVNGVADRYHCRRWIKLRHEVKSCVWDEKRSKWRVTVHDEAEGRTFEDEAEVLISARGGLNNLAWPSIPGLSSFAGKTMHSARWDPSFDCSGKRIGIIGNGSSGIQILPKVAELTDTQVTSFARSPTWISPSFGTHKIFENAGITGTSINEETRKRFREDPDFYQRFRVEVEEDQVLVHEATLLDTPMQKGGQKVFEENMRQKLAPKPDILSTLLPSFPPGCRRLTPGPGYLEALCRPNVKFVPTDIASIEKTGVRTKDGELHELDVLVCATGFHTDFRPPFPVSGVGGKDLGEHWSRYPRSYLSLSTDSFPNLWFILGPNAAIGAGSLTMMMEAEVDYATKCIRKIQKESIASMSVKSARVNDFVGYCDEYFKRTVYGTDCKSWYKNKEGRVSGLWPGATTHCIEAMRAPRWEDYEYSYGRDESGRERNAMGWLGNGWSWNMTEQRDTAWYLYPEFVSKPEEYPEENETNTVRLWSH